MHGGTLVETLLNTLEAEGYARGPMLLTIVDELCARGGLETAADAAFTILEGSSRVGCRSSILRRVSERFVISSERLV